MASPFHYFRKHQKALMAVAAVACMLIFVVGDALSGRGGGAGGRAANATVVSWDGGTLTARQLQSLTEQRYIVSEFLTQLFALGYDPENPEPVQAPDFRIRRDAAREAVENHVINTYILADLAEEAGMTVTDNIINEYIKKIGHGRVGQQEIVQIFSRLGRDTGSVENLVFENLRRLLLAYYYRTTFLDAGRVVMPQDRWEDWRQINDKLALNAAVLPADSFFDEVEEPSEAELLDLYGQLKDMPSNLMVDAGGRPMPSPEAGFTTPRKVKLHYLKGSLVDWREKFRDEVTEEAIQEFYETNKQLLYLLPEDDGAGSDDPAANPPADEAADEDAGETTEEDAEEETPATTTPPPAEDSPETPTEDAPEDDAPEEDSPEEDSPAEDSPVENAPEQSSSEESNPEESNPEEPAGDGSAEPATPSESEESAEEEEEEETTQDASEAEPADDPPPAAAPESEGEPTAEEADPATDVADEEPADEEPADGPAPSAEAEAAAVDAPDDAETPAETETEASDAGETESDEGRYRDQQYRPIEEVRAEIVDMLATEMAAEKLRETMEAANADLRRTFSQYGVQVAIADDEGTTPPEPPERLVDLEPVAEQYNLIFEKSALMTQRELATESIVGLARTVEGTGQAGPAVYQLAFSDELSLYEPTLTNEDPAREWQGDWYLVLKVEDQPSRTPELEEIRASVVEVWKRRQAAQKALAEAKKLADEFEASDQGFEEFFGSQEVEVVTTDLFSRKEFPNGPGQNEAPLLSTGFGLENAGAEFLDEAFALEGDQTKALLNFDESIAYVVQVRSRERTEEELRELFLREANGWPGMRETLAVRLNQFDATVQEQLWDSIHREFDSDWLERRNASQ